MQHFFGTVSWKSKYDIEFKGLGEGLHEFEFQIDDLFFEYFKESPVESGKVVIKVILEKRSSFLKLHFKLKGRIELMCDRCLDNYLQKIKLKTELFVKFGEKEFEEGENVIWVLPEEHQLNLAQLIYEFTILSIPLRHVHPKNNDGNRDCNREMLKKLKDHMHSEQGDETPVDPRWDALTKFGNNN